MQNNTYSFHPIETTLQLGRHNIVYIMTMIKALSVTEQFGQVGGVPALTDSN